MNLSPSDFPPGTGTSPSSLNSAAASSDDVENMSVMSFPVEDEPCDLRNSEKCWGEDNMSVADSSTEEEPNLAESTNINDLPDEILESIFARVSPYNDLDNVKCVCKKWSVLVKNVVKTLGTTFKQSIRDGTLQCVKKSSTLNDKGFVVQPWITERFGHMCCYCDKKIYVIGGSTYNLTTFNDLWSFDLSNRTWNRVIANGQYPSPKALGSLVKYKNNLVLFGGWTHPSPYPLMQPLLQPWRIFDELNVFDVKLNKWSLMESFGGPPPTAGHSATVHGDAMVVFGGRTFDQESQSFPLSAVVWVFDFTVNNWYKMKITGDGPSPSSRYGQTQIALDSQHCLVIGGCSGPNQIMSDVWLLTMTVDKTRIGGNWSLMTHQNPNILDFHYEGCKVGSHVIFFEKSTAVSPFLAFLHFDSHTHEQHGVLFQRSAITKSSTVLKTTTISPTMSLYSLDISKVLTDGTVSWSRDPVCNEKMTKLVRPNERLLYTSVPGRCEMILFGGFYKDPNANRCRVSSDIYFIGSPHKTY